MSLYELVFIIRPEVSSADIDKITNDFVKIVNDNGGKVEKNEYWGLKVFEYEINNYKKGHYIFLGLNIDSTVLKEIERKMKLSEDVLRSLSTKVEAITADPSPILRGKSYDTEEIIDVTSNKE